MLHIAICEDEQFFLNMEAKMVADILEQHLEPCQIDTYSSSVMLSDALNRNAFYDILLLDIDMPHLNGIDLGVTAKRTLPGSVRIYISAKTDLVFDSFAAQPFAFIPKDQIDLRLGPVLESVIVEMANRRQPISLDTGKGRLQTDVESFVYAEALCRKVLLHIDDNVFETTVQLKALEEQLSSMGFLRIHKAFLVNYRFIFRINKSVVILKDGRELPLSKHRAPIIRQKYLLLSSE